MLQKLQTVFKFTIIGLAIISLLALGTEQATGQNEQGNGLALSTLVEELEAVPGSTIKLEEPIVVKNVTANNLTVRVNYNDFLPAEDESGTPQIVVREDEQSSEYGLKTYFRPVEDFTLEPDQSIEIPITLDVPTNATPGGHYGIIRFTAVNPANPSQDVTLSASVGTIVLLNVPGDVVESLSLVEFAAAQNGETGSYFSSSPNQLVTRIQNNGNTHASPFGKIEVTNFLGNARETIEFNTNTSRRSFALPDSVRRFESQLTEDYPFGRYEVNGNISYGDGGEIIQLSTSFWVIPYQVIAAVLIGLPVLFFGGRFALRRYNERVVAKSRRR